MSGKKGPAFSLLRCYVLINHVVSCSDRKERLRAEGKLQQHIDRLNRMLENSEHPTLRR